jgi:hypothetical protein
MLTNKANTRLFFSQPLSLAMYFSLLNQLLCTGFLNSVAYISRCSETVRFTKKVQRKTSCLVKDSTVSVPFICGIDGTL